MLSKSSLNPKQGFVHYRNKLISRWQKCVSRGSRIPEPVRIMECLEGSLMVHGGSIKERGANSHRGGWRGPELCDCSQQQGENGLSL